MPSNPMPPVVYGLLSGTTAFPSSGFTMGAAVNSASRKISARALRHPAPARIATLVPAVDQIRGRLQ